MVACNHKLVAGRPCGQKCYRTRAAGAMFAECAAIIFSLIFAGCAGCGQGRQRPENSIIIPIHKSVQYRPRLTAKPFRCESAYLRLF